MKRWSWLGLGFAIAMLVTLLGWQASPWFSSDPPGLAPRQITAAPLALPTVEAQSLSAIVTALAFPRREAEDRDRARTYLQSTLTAWGWQVAAIPFTQGAYSGINLVATLGDDRPTMPPLLLASHYDTVDRSPGADDNASALAVLLTVAQLAAAAPTPPHLMLAFFDQEEVGLVGSQAFVAALGAADQTLQGAIVLDMVGYTCTEAHCQQYPAELPAMLRRGDRGDFLAVIGRWDDHTLRSTLAQVATVPVETVGLPPAAVPPDLLRSDHAPFWQHDLPAVLVTDTGNFRNPHYHQPSDLPETIDLAFLARVTQTVWQAVQLLAP